MSVSTAGPSHDGLNETKQSKSQALFLTWKYLSFEEVERVRALRDASAARDFLEYTLHLDAIFPKKGGDHLQDTRRACLSDLLMQALQFSLSLKMTARHASTLVSLVMETHIFACSPHHLDTPVKQDSLTKTPRGKEEVLAFVEAQLLRHSVDRPPYSIAVFPAPMLEAIREWVWKKQIVPLKMYQYVFGVHRWLVTQGK